MIDLKQRLGALRMRLERGLRRRLQQVEQPGRNLDVHADDTYIVSYPKSGNTWVRFLVSSLLHPTSRTDFANIDERVPTIYKASTSALAALPRPRVLKSHEYFDPRYPRVIYVVRDPRDVLVSYFHYQRRKGDIDEGETMSEFADRFMAGRLSPFGSWQENVASWLAVRDTGEDFLLVRYEDLLAETSIQLGRIARFLGREATERELTRVVAECSFDTMRALEAETGNRSAHLRHVRTDIGFVRQGKSGTWATELPEAVSSNIERRWHPLLERLGYETSARIKQSADS